MTVQIAGASLESHEKFSPKPKDSKVYYIYGILLLSQFSNSLKEGNEVSWAHFVLGEYTPLFRVHCLYAKYFLNTYKPSVK